MAVIKITNNDFRKMIRECVERVLSESSHILQEALIVDKYMDEIQEMTDKICDELDNRYHNKEGWHYEDEGNLFRDSEYYENDETPMYKNVGKLCGVNVILIWDPNDTSGHLAAFNDMADEIWVLCRGNERRNDIFEHLTHELTHKFDRDIGKAYNTERFNPEVMGDDVWYIFREILYLLWSPTEFNARQSIVAFGDMSRTNWYVRYLEKHLKECVEVSEDDVAWDKLARELSRYYGDKILEWPRKRVRDFFLKKSYYLFNKFKRKVRRKTMHYADLSESLYSGLDDVEKGEELTDAALSKGFNLIGYHNTNKPNLKNFYKRSAGIHFGSLKAANDRGKERDWDDEVENWSNKYFLKAQKPLVIEKDFDWEMASFDDWSSPDDDKYFDDINIFAYFEKELGWDIKDKDIKEIINEHGYDCIIYKNEREDVGNYSIAMFEPNNIKLACETTDDTGNPIPLRERFNTSINDVRY